MLRAIKPPLVLLTMLLSGALAPAREHAAVVPYLSDDVSSVAYVDLEKVDIAAALEELIKLKIIPESERAEARQQSAAVQNLYAELTNRGARRIYVLVRMSGVFEGGPTCLIEVADDKQPQAVIGWLKPWLEKAKELGDAAQFAPREMTADGNVILAASSAKRLELLKKSRTDSPRKEAVAALAALGDAAAGFVAFGDADSRRVVREMFPQLPPPFMEIDGKLLADGLKWCGVTIALTPTPTISLKLETFGDEVAATLEQSAVKALELAKALMLKELVDGPPVHQARAKEILPILPLLKPQVEGKRVTIAFGDDEGELNFIRNMLPMLLEGMRADAYRARRMNQFKQIALGLHNHESAQSAFPAAASYDADGKPLLSWRVQILPYVEQKALYNQFHLDEPWDSEHNRKLVDKMPEVYADPDPAIRNSIDKGHTTFVVPVGKGLIFEGREAPKWRDIKDGTSQTILALEVVPERAVPWTKPADWEVDLKNPLEGVTRGDRDFFVAAYADGSVRILHKSSVDAQTLRAVLTRAGGEAINPF